MSNTRLFSTVACEYSLFRPGYPDELFEWLARAAPALDAVWDCGCGSGQASVPLAAHFSRVFATDAAAEQVAAAKRHPRVQYSVATAENSGLAGASVAASLSELGHRVTCLSFHDSPRRAHSVAAQGGINACKNYQNDGDSADRLFYDTLKGGDYRSREANVYRLAQLSVNIIDQCVAQGVPFAREYGGHLQNRSFGGALVSRTFCWSTRRTSRLRTPSGTCSVVAGWERRRSTR